MIASTAPDFSDVLSRVASWPPQLRIMLARQVLETLEGAPDAEHRTTAGGFPSKQRVAELVRGLRPPNISQPAKTLPVDQVIGVLKPEGPTPGDAECQQILEDERLRKYG
jgi:hypothetical protein